MKHSFLQWAHFILWPLYFILFFSLTQYFLPVKIAATSSALIIFSAMLLFYIHSWWIFPRYFEPRQYGRYLSFVLLLILIITTVMLLGDLYLFADFHAESDKEIPLIFPIFRHISILLFFYFTSFAYSLIQKLRTQSLREKKLSEEKLQTEIRLLKAQIDPHFIFNSLNNIYSLAYESNKRTPEAVLMLSQMLRYVYYDCSKERVPISAEIDYINNFIAFQQMKSSHPQAISFHYTPNVQSKRIAPMLFVPFIENSFKYSKIEEYPDGYVDIELKSNPEGIEFAIRNSIPETGKASNGSGTGIENVKNRLKLTYPGKYKLNIEAAETVYQVQLIIQTP
ncbi:MAG: histidine kinase [Bacteroidales bacterium]